MRALQLIRDNSQFRGLVALPHMVALEPIGTCRATRELLIPPLLEHA
jgi:hypothetical protein